LCGKFLYVCNLKKKHSCTELQKCSKSTNLAIVCSTNNLLHFGLGRIILIESGLPISYMYLPSKCSFFVSSSFHTIRFNDTNYIVLRAQKFVLHSAKLHSFIHYYYYYYYCCCCCCCCCYYYYYNGNWTEWSVIWSAIIPGVLKSNSSCVLIWFEITSMISDQNCMTRSSVANSLYETCLQGIMVVVLIKTNIQSKKMITTTMILCRHVKRELAIATLLHPFWNRTIFHLNTGFGEYHYFIDPVDSWLRKKANLKCFSFSMQNRKT